MIGGPSTSLPGARRAILGAIVCLTLVSCASGDARAPASSSVSSASPSVPAQSASPSVPAPSASAAETVGLTRSRTVELQLTSALQIIQDGARVADIPLTPGETIHFVITNTAGFDHDFYIGTGSELAAGQIEGLPGLPTWSTDRPEAFDWVVPTEVAGLEFGCTLRGHYPTMHGAFSLVGG